MSDKLVKRLRELSDAVTRECWSEFYMRVPAEPDHDGDLVLMRAADRIAELEAHIQEAADVNTYALKTGTHPALVELHEASRDWHLAALQPTAQEGT